MNNNIIIFGYGSGTSRAVAYQFGQRGYAIGLVARNAEKLKEAISELKSANIEAHAFVCDLSDITKIPELIAEIQNQFKVIKNIHWNAFHDIEGNLTDVAHADINTSFQVRVSSYIATIQACLDDLKLSHGSILSTNGIFALDLNEVHQISQEYALLAIAATAQYKTTNLFSHTLKNSNVYVGQVIVNGFIEGTSGSKGRAYTVHPEEIAVSFWELHQNKNTTTALCGAAINIA